MEEKKNITQELDLAKKEGANLLMPTTLIEGLSEFHGVVVEKVYLSPNKDDGDVYPHGSGNKMRPTKQALMKLSVCAGVIWSPDQSKRIDNGADRNYIAYRAVGGLRKADGQPVFFSAEYDIDFEVLEEELRDSYTGKAENPPENLAWLKKKSPQDRAAWIEDCVKRDMLQKRKFKLRLCEAGAMNRVLRMLLGIKQAYSPDELKKPFVMARIVFKPDFSDASVRQQFIDASIKAMTGVYGPGTAAAMPKEAEPINITPCPPCPDEPEDNPEPTNGAFEKMDLTGRITALESLAKEVAYDLPDYVKRSKAKSLAELGDKTIENLYKHLLTKKKPVGDVPF